MKSFFVRLCACLVIVIAGISVNTNVFSSGLFGDQETQVPYCSDGGCGLNEGINEVSWWVTGLVTDRSLSDYIQDIVVFLLGFLAVISVIYIIYAGFILLISWWDEEKLKSSRRIIFYVILWIILIWLAYSIMTWVVSVLNETIPVV